MSRHATPAVAFRRLLAGAVLLLGVAPGASAAEWQGTVEKRDGITQVSNPETPVEPRLELEPETLWEIGGYSDNEGEFFGLITDIVFDAQGNLYLLDRQLNEVKVFSRNGAYLRTIGREGEGPGEFRRPGSLFFLPNGDLAVVQSFPGKIITLTPEGAPGDEFPLTSAEEGGFRALMQGRFRGGSLVFRGGNFKMGDGKMTRSSALVRIGLEGQEAARFTEESTTTTMGNIIVREKETLGMPWDILPDGRVVASRTFEYEITIWNPDGTTDRLVTRDYEPLVRNKDELAAAEKRLASQVRFRGGGGRIKPTIEVEKQERSIEDLVVLDSGHMLVLSSRGSKRAPEGVCAVYDVYDGDGRFLQQLSLVVDADLEEDRLVFSGDRLFVIKEFAAAARAARGGMSEDEEEELEESDEEPEPISVVCYRFEWAPQAVASPARD